MSYNVWMEIHELPQNPIMTFVLHPFIRYSQIPIIPGHNTGIVWDMRESPTFARRLVNPDQPLSPNDLAQHATNPPCVFLSITSDLFYGDRPIEARRLQGVRIGDVFNAIYEALQQPVRHDEWEKLSDSQRKRISDVFEQRCRMAVDRDKIHAQGVLRVDCLQHTTWFAGLSNSLEIDCSCILSVCRPK